MDLHGWQWMFLATAAFLVGLSKTGIAGLGILPVALFANALTARESTGALLPLLLAGDVLGWLSSANTPTGLTSGNFFLG